MSTYRTTPAMYQSLPVQVPRNFDNVVEFTLTAPDADGVQQPVDLTGCTAVFSVRDTWLGTVKIPPVVNGPDAHSSPTAGKTAFALTKAQVNADATGGQRSVTWQYAVRVTWPDNHQAVLVQGQFIVQPTVDP